jgi:hypothetical protein
MQKLTGISSGQNNKSCRIFHHEPNKTGFPFFRFFYDFIRNLQESGNHFYYFSCAFAAGTLERKFSLQCGPGRGWPARVGQIPARFAGVWPGKGRGMARGSPRVNLSRSWGWEGSGGSADGGGRRLPLRPSLRRGCQPGWAIRGSGGCGRGSWWRVCARVAVRWRGGRTSPRAAMAAWLQHVVLAGAARSSMQGFGHLK